MPETTAVRHTGTVMPETTAVIRDHAYINQCQTTGKVNFFHLFWKRRPWLLVLLMALSMNQCHSVAVSNLATNNIHEYQPCPLYLESQLQTVNLSGI